MTAAGPIVDTKTSTIDTRFDSEMLAKLPTSRDAFYDLALTAPGMFEGSALPARPPIPEPHGLRQRDQRERLPHQRRQRHLPRAGSFGSLVNVNYDAVEEVRIVATGSKAEYGSFSGAAIDVLTKSGSNDVPRQRRVLLEARNARRQPARRQRDVRDGLPVRGRGRAARGRDQEGLGGQLHAGRPDPARTSSGSSARSTTSATPACRRGGRSRANPGAAMPTRRSRPRPSRIIAPGRSYHYENNDGNGGSWGSEPAWDTTMTYGTEAMNHTPLAQWQWFPNNKTTASAKYLGFWTDDQPYVPRTRPTIPATSTGGSGPTTASTARSPTSRPRSRAARPCRPTSRTTPRSSSASTTSSSACSTRRGAATGRAATSRTTSTSSIPYRWTQSVQYMQDWYGDTGLRLLQPQGHAQPVPHRAHGRLRRECSSTTSGRLTKRLTVNLGLRFDRMTTKYGVGKVYDFVTSPDEINGRLPFSATGPRPTTSSTSRRGRLGSGVSLHADGGRQDRRAGRVRPLLPADQRRDPETIRPGHAPRGAHHPDLRGRTLEHGRHQRRRGDRHDRDARRGAQGPRTDAVQRGRRTRATPPGRSTWPTT